MGGASDVMCSVKTNQLHENPGSPPSAMLGGQAVGTAAGVEDSLL